MPAVLYDYLVALISVKEGISDYEACDIVDECMNQLNGVKDGTNDNYDSYGAVLRDYLDLGDSFIRLFPDYTGE